MVSKGLTGAVIPGLHAEPSYPAHAGYPVRRGVSILPRRLWNTGSLRRSLSSGRPKAGPVGGRRRPRGWREEGTQGVRAPSARHTPRMRGNQYAAASRSNRAVSGILGRPVKPGDDDRREWREFSNSRIIRETHRRVLAARCVRVLRNDCAIWKTEGAGNAGCPMHPQPRVRFVVGVCTRVFTAEAPDTSGIPHAMVLTAYIVLSPGTGLFCPRRPWTTPRP
jgi:hypothetical protein